MSDYADILHLSRPRSQKRASMSLLDRAAQFSSFAALTGFEEVIEETGRLTDTFAEMDESAKAHINAQLQALSARISSRPTVSVTYFQPDGRKEGGSYQTKVGALKAIDEPQQCLRFTDRTEIPFHCIICIT